MEMADVKLYFDANAEWSYREETTDHREMIGEEQAYYEKTVKKLTLSGWTANLYTYEKGDVEDD